MEARRRDLRGFVAGAFVLTDTLGKTFDNLFSTVNQKVAVDVRGTVTTTGDFGDVRHQLPEALVATVAGVDGVADAKGNINAGGNGMPAYADMLSDDEKNDLIAYLKTI